jgi:hypothetical protein
VIKPFSNGNDGNDGKNNGKRRSGINTCLTLQHLTSFHVIHLKGENA